MNSERIVRFSKADLDVMVRRGEDLTDWPRVDALNDEEIEASIAFEEEGEPIWEPLQIDLPLTKRQVTVRLDPDVLEFFQAGGRGYQTRINAVLRSYVDAQKQRKAR